MAVLRVAVFSAIREKPEGRGFFAPPPPVRVLSANNLLKANIAENCVLFSFF